MRWEMEMNEIEAVLETIWELHDKISDAIHAISRSHFLTSLAANKNLGGTANSGGDEEEEQKLGGFVFVKDFDGGRAGADDASAMAEARSLNAIRTAFENLEDQLEFFHTMQSQQRAERDAALARLEQSRIVLAMRLADHRGKKCKVIEEALAFVGDVHDASRYAAPENLFGMPRNQPGETKEDQHGKRPGIFMRMLISSLALAKNSLGMERIGPVLGNAALFAVSMFAFLQLHQVAFRTPQLQDRSFYPQRINRSKAEQDSSSQMRQFDVFSARG